MIFILVNNYEINTIMCSFLQIWHRSSYGEIALLNKMLELFPTQYHRLVKFFFLESILLFI